MDKDKICTLKELIFYVVSLRLSSIIDGFVKSPSVPPRRDCASSLVIAAYYKYASFLKIRAPCIWRFLLYRPFHDFLRSHHY